MRFGKIQSPNLTEQYATLFIVSQSSHPSISIQSRHKQSRIRTCGDIARACCFIRVMTSARTVLTRESQCAEGTFTFCSATTELLNQTNHQFSNNHRTDQGQFDCQVPTDLNIDAENNATLFEGGQVLTGHLQAAAPPSKSITDMWK